MPTLAGFYAACPLPCSSSTSRLTSLQSHQDCREWLREFSPQLYNKSELIGAAVASIAAEDMMQKLTKYSIFKGELITPLGSSSDPYDIQPRALMLVRRYSPHREYIAPSRGGFDVNGKKLIKQHLGLNVSGWKVVWYDENDRTLQTFALEPKPKDDLA